MKKQIIYVTKVKKWYGEDSEPSCIEGFCLCDEKGEWIGIAGVFKMERQYFRKVEDVKDFFRQLKIEVVIMEITIHRGEPCNDSTS